MRAGNERCTRCNRTIPMSEMVHTVCRDNGFGFRSWHYHADCWRETDREEREQRAKNDARAAEWKVRAGMTPTQREVEALRDALALLGTDDAMARRAEDASLYGIRLCRHGIDEIDCDTCESIKQDAAREVAGRDNDDDNNDEGND